MAKDVPALDILRLLCLQSLVGGGLKPKELDGLRKQFLQVKPLERQCAYGRLMVTSI